MIDEKIKTREELALLCDDLRKRGKKIGFTSGSFDILHAGHVSYLEKARQKCDILVVGINTDSSVRKYKGEKRPIVPEQERLRLVAALKSVDYAFLFDERRNEENIKALKPDFYIKAGDYKESELTSARFLKPWGGQVILVPQEPGMSSSAIIEKIVSSHKAASTDDGIHSAIEKRIIKSSPAVFLDRDGVINDEMHFLHEPEKFRMLPNVIEGLKKMQDMHYRLIMITDQGGIGMGYYTKEDFFKVNSKMLGMFSKAGIMIDKIYYCPHSPAEKCDCRKPGTAMFERAKKDLNIDMHHSFMIGDKTNDILGGQNAGVKTILVMTGHAGNDKQYDVKPDYVAKDLVDAAGWISDMEKR